MKMCNVKVFGAIGLVFLMLSSACLLPVTLADKNNAVPSDIGFDKGPSSLPVIPLKKATFIGFDKETLLDDYAYLACVPTAVFQNDEKLYSHPLLFFEDEYKYEADKERSLNARQGLENFIEDCKIGICLEGERSENNIVNHNKISSIQSNVLLKEAGIRNLIKTNDLLYPNKNLNGVIFILKTQEILQLSATIIKVMDSKLKLYLGMQALENYDLGE